MSSLTSFRREQHGRPSATKSNKLYKPFLPTYSPQEGHLKEGEDMLSIEELWRCLAGYSRGTEDNHERYKCSQMDGASSRDARKEELFRHFYEVLQKVWDREGPVDCAVVSLNEKQRDYARAIGHRLRDRGLVVEIIQLASELGLTQALQEVKDDGSPFCILVEQANVRWSSCTVIMLDESIKIHRHMPLEDALMLVAKEFRKSFETRSTRISKRAADLVDDFLAREHHVSYSVPFSIQHLLFLLSEGKHLCGAELSLVIDYLNARKEQSQGLEMWDPSSCNDPTLFQTRSTPIVEKPPPLLPTPGTESFLGVPPSRPVKSFSSGNRCRGGLLPLPELVNPKAVFSPSLLQAAPPKRPAPPRRSAATPAKRPLLGEKPGLLVPSPVSLQLVPPNWAIQPVSLVN